MKLRHWGVYPRLVPVAEKAVLVGVLAPMRADIVEKKQMQILAGQ